MEVFAYQPPPREANQPAGAVELPLGGFGVTPATVGKQIVRVSLPFAAGTLPAGAGLKVRSGEWS